jgi:hypothetical protein
MPNAARHLGGAALLVSRGIKVLQAALAAELRRHGASGSRHSGRSFLGLLIRVLTATASISFAGKGRKSGWSCTASASGARQASRVTRNTKTPGNPGVLYVYLLYEAAALTTELPRLISCRSIVIVLVRSNPASRFRRTAFFARGRSDFVQNATCRGPIISREVVDHWLPDTVDRCN